MARFYPRIAVIARSKTMTRLVEACQQRLQLVDALRPAVFHALQVFHRELHHRRTPRMQGQRDPAAFLREGNGREPFRDVIAVAVQRVVCENKPLRRYDLADLAVHRIDGAIGRAHVDADGAADACIELADRIGKAFRPPPLCQRRGIGPGRKHPRARRVEGARDGDFTFGKRFAWCGCGHGKKLLFAYCGTITIQATPNLSVSMPKRGEKKVLASGIVTWPSSPSVAKILSASVSSLAKIVRAKPWKFGLPWLRPSEASSIASPIWICACMTLSLEPGETIDWSGAS